MKRLTITVALATFAYAFAEHYLHVPLTDYLIGYFPALRPVLKIPMVDHSVAGLVAILLHLIDWVFVIFLLWPTLVVWLLSGHLVLCILAEAAWIIFAVWLGSNVEASAEDVPAT
jgi:hypothetical protein